MLPAKNLLTEKDGDPQRVMDSLLRASHLAPSKFLRFGSELMKSSFFKGLGMKFYPQKGVNVWDIPVRLKQAVTEIIGTEQVEGVRVVDIDVHGNRIPQTERTISVDFVCIAGGLYPLVELAAVAGCPFKYIEELGGHVPIHRDTMKTPLAGLYVAGNITGIESAKVAMAQGEAAGFSIAYDTLLRQPLKEALKMALQKVEKTRETSAFKFHPAIEKGREQMHMSFHISDQMLPRKEG